MVFGVTPEGRLRFANDNGSLVNNVAALGAMDTTPNFMLHIDVSDSVSASVRRLTFSLYNLGTPNARPASYSEDVSLNAEYIFPKNNLTGFPYDSLIALHFNGQDSISTDSRSAVIVSHTRAITAGSDGTLVVETKSQYGLRRGISYALYKDIGSIGLNDSVALTFIVPTGSTVRPVFTVEANTLTTARLYIREADTVATPTDTLTAWNRDRESSNTPQMIMSNSAAAGSGGTLLPVLDLGSGVKGSDGDQEHAEIMAARGLRYSVLLVSLAASNGGVIAIKWTEELAHSQ